MFSYVDLFSGAGGLSRGFQESGAYTHLLGVDFDADAISTYRENIGDGLRASLRRISTFRELPECDVQIGGPPCQPFSIAGQRRGTKDARNGWSAFLLALRYTHARAFVAENVAAMSYKPSRPYLERVMTSASRLGYYVQWRVLDAADYSVPQHRKRLFLVGFRDAQASRRFSWPLPTHSRFGDLWTIPYMSAADALVERLQRRAPDPDGLPQWLRLAGGLVDVAQNQGTPTLVKGHLSLFARQHAEAAEAAEAQKTEASATLVRGITGGWAKVNLGCYAQAHSTVGGSWHAEKIEKLTAIVPAIVNGREGHRIREASRRRAALYDGKGHRQFKANRYGPQGQNWQPLDWPAFTMTASSGQSHRVVIGECVWRLLNEDMATLQSFSDDWRWMGATIASVNRQIGNAVSPPLARAVATAVAEALR